MSFSATTNVMRQLPLTLTAQVSGSHAFEFVQPKPRQIHVHGSGGDIQAAEDHAQAVGVFGLNAGLGARPKEAFQAFVSKFLDRHCRQCNVYGYRWQSA